MLTRRTWTALILLGFAGQLAWAVENQYFDTFVYDKVALFLFSLARSYPVLALTGVLWLAPYSNRCKPCRRSRTPA